VLEVPPSETIELKRAFVKRRSAKGVLIEMIDGKDAGVLIGSH